MIGAIGIMLGIIGGVLLATHATQVVNFIQNTFHVSLISSDVYIVDYLPSKLEWRDVLHVCSITFFYQFDRDDLSGSAGQSHSTGGGVAL